MRLNEGLVTPEARADLIEAFKFIQSHNPAAARAVTAIKRRCASLSEQPRRDIRLGSSRGEEVRRLIVEPFVIIYICADENVRIVRVYHGARDFRGALHAILDRNESEA
jgi:plasmid stabilization system protein ParE